MGILNVTPDSFSRDGVAGQPSKIRERIHRLVDERPDVLDIGGESTRPGASSVSVDTEISRVLPAIEMAQSIADHLPISVDTRRARVAQKAIEAGANMVNDVSGSMHDPELVDVVVSAGVPLVVTHNRPAEPMMTPLGGQFRAVEYLNVSEEVLREGEELCARVVARGVDQDLLIFDPGFGFGKTPVQNIQLLHDLELVRQVGFPILVGVSRKSFIGELTGQPVKNRLAGSLSAAVLGAMRGADMVRVHDVAATRDALAVADGVFRHL
jgi:dihydropteroate synthase